ncbi:recombinase family protein [Vibrio natriegens]|uniref:recombinase family protein n=1 Tax=Vibrio natriegens TaxID=691 RepID=UPI00390AFEAE
MPTAYSYVRFSTPEQILGNSQSRQYQMAFDYCQKNGLELSKRNFKDLGISGFSGKTRPSLQEMLECIEHGVIKPGDYILIETFDRLSRQGVDATQQLVRTILLSGVVVVALLDDLVLTKASLDESAVIIRLAIAADLAHKESLRKSERLKAARKQKRVDAAKGEPSLISTNLPFWLSLDAGKIVINESKAALVNRIYDMSVDGHGFMSIINILNTEKIPAPKAKIWAKSTISKLLKNRAVLGEIQPYTTKGNKRVEDTSIGVIPHYYPQIISEEKFLAVQVAKQNRKTYQGGNRTKKEVFSNLFQRFAKCGQCGSTMEYVDKGKPPRGGQYLTCSAAKRGGECTQKKNFKYGVLESTLYNILLTGKISIEKPISKSKISQLTQLEFELTQKKKSYSSFLESGVDFTMKEVIVAAKNKEATIKELEAKVKELQWEVSSSDTDDTQFLMDNLKKLINNTKENFHLRSKFNLALIKKFGYCSIKEIQGYTRIIIGNDGAMFVSPDCKWLLPYFSGFMPISLITNQSTLSANMSAIEMEKQVMNFFDSMIEAIPDSKVTFEKNRDACLLEIKKYVSDGVLPSYI